MIDAYRNVVAAESIQADREAAIRRGDILESKDLEFDYAHNFIATRLKYGAKDAIASEIADLRLAAIENFVGLQQTEVATALDTKESFLARLANIETHAAHASKMYDAATLKYSGVVNKETGERVYSDAVIEKLVYAGSKVMDYDRRLPELNSELAVAGVNTMAVLEDVMVSGIPSEESIKGALADVADSDTLDKDDLKVALQDVIELAMRRREFVKEYQDIKNKPENYTEKPAGEKKLAEETPKEKITIKTKKIDKLK
jgi:hypothetical protein